MHNAVLLDSGKVRHRKGEKKGRKKGGESEHARKVEKEIPRIDRWRRRRRRSSSSSSKKRKKYQNESEI